MAESAITPEAELAALKQELLNAQRFAALGELVGTTTHEFNNVLMTIINYAKIGLRNKDEATRDKALDRITSGVRSVGAKSSLRLRAMPSTALVIRSARWAALMMRSRALSRVASSLFRRPILA